MRGAFKFRIPDFHSRGQARIRRKKRRANKCWHTYSSCLALRRLRNQTHTHRHTNARTKEVLQVHLNCAQNSSLLCWHERWLDFYLFSKQADHSLSLPLLVVMEQRALVSLLWVRTGGDKQIGERSSLRLTYLSIFLLSPAQWLFLFSWL